MAHSNCKETPGEELSTMNKVLGAGASVAQVCSFLHPNG